tara:strand:+ start:1338 stop:3569 length:2232 start_codon:yes stop_codon:yes gene_type:complete
MITREDFINNIFADKTETEQVCVTRSMPKKDGDGVWFKNHIPTDRQWRKWKPEEQDQAWYFCVSTITGEMNEKGTMVRRGRSQLVRAHCLVLDDIGTKASRPPVEPTWKLESSAGNEQWGYMLDPTDDLGKYEALVEYCHQQGWGDAGAGGSYRVMRVPGSTNLKPGRGAFKSRVTAWSGNVWSLDELADDLGCDFENVEIKELGVSVSSGGADAREGIDVMLDWLADAGHVVEDKGQWVDVVCPWADSHTSGGNTAGYSALGRGDGDWVQTRAFRCLHEHCNGHKLGDFVKWAEKAGGPYVTGYDPLPWLQDRYAYIGMGQQVVDLHQRVRGGDWIWELADWSKRHPGKIVAGGERDKIKVSDAFVASKETKHVDRTAYVPVPKAADTGLIELRGQKALNMYVPPNWVETDETPEVFIDHMNYLIPDAGEREVFIDWLAFKFQNPGRRSWGVVMVAENTFGTGRSWIKTMLAKTLQQAVNTATLGQLIGRGTSAEQTYNDWMSRCQYICVEEAKESIDRDVFFQAYEVFKQNVDPAVGVDIRINPKFGRTRIENIYYNALIFTNHRDALAIPGNDRRVYVIRNPTKMESPAYYDRLVSSLDNGEPRRIYWYLMRRDVSAFDPIYPKMTPGKAAMIDDNHSPADEIFEHLLEHIVPDLVTKSTFKRAVTDAAMKLDYDNIALKPGGVVKLLWGRLPQLRDDVNGARYYLDGAQRVVKAIRNTEKWVLVDQDRDKIVIAEGLKG